MSALLTAGIRPARLFAPVLVLAGALLLLGAVVGGVRITDRPATVLAEGPPGQPLHLAPTATTGPLTVLAATAGDAGTTVQDRCHVSAGRNVVSGAYGDRETTFRGRTYRPFARVAHGWTDDRTLTCSGPHLQRLLVVRDHRSHQTMVCLLMALAGAGGVGLGLAGLAARGRRRGPDTVSRCPR